MADEQFLDGPYPLLKREYDLRYAMCCRNIHEVVGDLRWNRWYQSGEGVHRTMRFCVVAGAGDHLWVARANAHKVLQSPQPHMVAVDLYRLHTTKKVPVAMAKVRYRRFGIVDGNIDSKELQLRTEEPNLSLQEPTLNELRPFERQLLNLGFSPVG